MGNPYLPSGEGVREITPAKGFSKAFSLNDALAAAEMLLQAKQSAGDAAEFRPKTLRSAVKANPDANVAVISVAGRYAAAEAWEALRGGVHPGTRRPVAA